MERMTERMTEKLHKLTISFVEKHQIKPSDEKIRIGVRNSNMRNKANIIEMLENNIYDHIRFLFISMLRGDRGAKLRLKTIKDKLTK